MLEKIRSKMLEGKLVDGNQPHIVSYDDFLRAQEMKSNRTGVYTHKKRNTTLSFENAMFCVLKTILRLQLTQ